MAVVGSGCCRKVAVVGLVVVERLNTLEPLYKMGNYDSF